MYIFHMRKVKLKFLKVAQLLRDRARLTLRPEPGLLRTRQAAQGDAVSGRGGKIPALTLSVYKQPKLGKSMDYSQVLHSLNFFLLDETSI